MTDYVKMDTQTLAAKHKFNWFQFRDGDTILNLGCGSDYQEGWTNLDGDPSVKADVHHDLELSPLPFKDNSFDTIFASHIIEHVHNLVPLQHEFNRLIARPHGRAHIVVPFYQSPDAWGDPTHCRTFSNQSFWPCYWPGVSKLWYKIIDFRPSEGPLSQWIFVTLFYGEELDEDK
jgi:predicted SAM-dependent methyltransferase